MFFNFSYTFKMRSVLAVIFQFIGRILLQKCLYDNTTNEIILLEYSLSGIIIYKVSKSMALLAPLQQTTGYHKCVLSPLNVNSIQNIL